MATSHVVGGGAAAFIGAAVVSVANHFFHVHVSDADAIVIGGAAVSAGAGLGRVIEKVGLIGMFKAVLHGSQKPSHPVVHNAPVGSSSVVSGPGVPGA